ncbi:hypothetical protein GRO01_14770 [Gluconobacter roseus NBRC 3990]|uniref:Uncharacterized protein n=2 Tax=Gluconobacter roseus TaxID=586239 RepID=A0A4Y3M9F6_9PROT|nr:hypothetical protein AA3990_0367 [Gluconobacter roseus NBRC 3990]GEB03901.1 hypothetical protein GRO01_14770 [Gluconobacter roseus NBRC 3990]GLP94354.1 hypothetical protein GCM10007871_23320 [Gluconobacter roseus NBRC 3990]
MVRTLDTGAYMPLGTELYTSEQLAEAVAAERERCAKLCEDKAHTIVQEQGSLPDFETGEVTLGELSQEAFEAFENAAEAIRSPAK